MRLPVVVSALLLVLALAAPPALAQNDEGGSGAFGPLPPAAPAETATPEPPPSVEAQQQNDRTLLFAIGAGLLVLFVLIARFITRDARRSLPAVSRADAARVREPATRTRRPPQAKAKARAKAKAQRQARRQNR